MWQSYHLVNELEHALALLAQHGVRARIMAGATDLLNELERQVRPDVDVIVDISNVPGLATIALNAVGEIELDALQERGISAAQLAGVHAPMGLELNAETPEEIAVSILAEIIMLRRGGSGAPMAAAGKPAAASGSA